MSTPMSPLSLLSPTRQQLDELDALMQKMLAIPLTPEAEENEAAASPPLSGAKVVAESSTGTPTAAMQVPAAAAVDRLPSNPPGPFPDTIWAVPVSFAAKLAAAPQSTLGSAGPLMLGPEVVHSPSSGTRRESARTLTAIGSGRARIRVPLPLFPFLWCNLLFDGCSLALGPLGRCLRGPAGRGLLGWVGIFLFLGTLAWVAWDWLDWTW